MIWSFVYRDILISVFTHCVIIRKWGSISAIKSEKQGISGLARGNLKK